jgi:hypothetical protein
MFKKFAVVSLVVLATHFVTSGLMRAYGDKPRRATQAPKKGQAPRKAIANAVVDQIDALTPDGESSVTFTNLDGPDSLACPGSVVPIQCRLDFYDNLSDQSLTWFVQVATQQDDGSYLTVLGQSYDDQAFVVPKGVTVAPTFADSITLAPGSYIVTVGVAEPRDGGTFPIASNYFMANVTP